MKKRSKGCSQTTVIREYFAVSEAANYMGISERLIRDLLKSPINPIPHFRIGSSGRIIKIKRADIDSWLENFKATNDVNINKIVDELTKYK